MVNLRPLVLGATLLASTSGFCGQSADDLSTCVAEASTAEDRVILVQWMFSAMSSHPSVKPLTSITPAQIDQINQKLSNMISRLLTVSCLDKAKAAMRAEGPEAVLGSFRFFGQFASADILSHPAVQEQMVTGLMKYQDPKMFEAIGM